MKWVQRAVAAGEVRDTNLIIILRSNSDEPSVSFPAAALPHQESFWTELAPGVASSLMVESACAFGGLEEGDRGVRCQTIR